MIDVLVVGAGPAGSVAATLLARAGVRVLMIDRASFPRPKLCGDTVNPGTLAMLRRIGLAEPARRGLRIDGMVVSGEGGVAVEAVYPRGLHGVSLTRAEFDRALVEEAMKAGAGFEAGVAARSAIVRQTADGTIIGGVLASDAHGRERRIDARVTIAADGRHSTLAFALGLARHAARPRRWAIGAYFEGVETPRVLAFGEMHIRRGRYIGIAPLPGGITNVCLVRPSGPGDAVLRDPLTALDAAINGEPLVADRFRRATALGAATVLGPLAVEDTGRSIDGLLVAGDAAGFVDPMTGDGLRFAVGGGALAAEAARRALEHGWTGVHAGLRRARHQEFCAKWRFNRALRALVASPAAVGLAARAARLTPSIVRAIVARAGDCDRAA